MKFKDLILSRASQNENGLDMPKIGIGKNKMWQKANQNKQFKGFDPIESFSEQK